MKSLSLFLITILTFTSVQAAHIIGGTVEYTVNSIEEDMVDIDVVFHVYRDANTNGAAFDEFIEIGLYGRGEGNNPLFNFIDLQSTNFENLQELDFSDVLECVPPSISIQSAIYRANFVFDIADNQEFVFAYQRCCRAPLTNLLVGDETGIALSVNITRAGITRLGSVRSFDNEFPASVVPAGGITFDLSIEDGLEKKYKIADALIAGGTEGVVSGDPSSCIGITPSVVNCPPPYDIPLYAPNTGSFGLGDQVNMDSITGKMYCGLISQGGHLIAVEAESFENGELLSTTRQQFVQIVSMCQSNSIIESGRMSSILYPAPATDMIYINDELTDVKIYDLTGQYMQMESTFNSNVGIDVSDFRPGVYLLIGYNQSGAKITKRFIK